MDKPLSWTHRVPQRLSLSTQVAEILRKDLRNGRWGDQLPPERKLAENLQVSRPTMRAALALLRDEGLIHVTQRRFRRVSPSARHPRHNEVKLVRLLSPMPSDELMAGDLFEVDELRRHLQKAGYTFEVHCDLRLIRKDPHKILERLLDLDTPACWLLLQQSTQVHRWFFKRKLPAIVVGSTEDSLGLPSIDFDYKAVCRHAAGACLSLGHRRIALVSRRVGFAGDLSSEEGFREAFLSGIGRQASNVVLHHDATVAGIRRVLSPHFLAQDRPTAVLVSRASDVLTVLTFLLNSGIRIPRDVSLISRDNDPCLAHVVPSLARYIYDDSRFGRQLYHMVLHLANDGSAATRQIRIAADFQKGETLVPVGLS